MNVQTPASRNVICVLRQNNRGNPHNLDQQRRACRAGADAIGAKVIDEVVLGDRSTDRRGEDDLFDEIINRKKGGEEFQSILVADFSRLSRDVFEITRLQFRLQDAHVSIIAL